MRTVLIALHYQNEVLHADGKIRVGVAEKSDGREELKEKAARLLAAVRGHGIPVVLVRIAFRPDHADVVQNGKIFRDVVANKAMIDGSWGADFHDGFGPVDGEYVVKHSRNNAFYGSQLEEVLRVLKAERLVIAGISTNFVVEATVRCASDMGYEIIVASDACSSASLAQHQASLENMKLLADIMTVDEVAQMIAAGGLQS
ncbi:cysteine hydrolase family protein [Brucella tritici]|uniref:cysteine hydrolase family protein n=1 Tax=Brucella tritici TaxID=94626 RepID=UPI001590FBB5|nr:isochorismatase family cysteine hydrolase [Brucella tritici]